MGWVDKKGKRGRTGRASNVGKGMKVMSETRPTRQTISKGRVRTAYDGNRKGR